MTDRRPVGFGRREGDAGAATGAGAGPAPAGAVLLDDESMAKLIPERAKRGHKGSFGKLLVIAGSLDYAGAALLVCRAAGRAGAGLVTLAVPESLQPLFAAKVVEATTMALPEDDVEEVDPEPALAKILDHEHDALVIGPGLRPSLATADLLRLLLTAPEEGTAGPVVLDAEALRTLASADGWWGGVTRPCVLTPHAGEFARLRAGSGHEPGDDGDLNEDDEARVRAAAAAAGEWKQVVVLKGARTVIAGPDGTVAVAPFENPAMASGGTGDVLAGHDRGAARAGPRAVRRRTPRRLPPRPRRRGRRRADRRRGPPRGRSARRPADRAQAPRRDRGAPADRAAARVRGASVRGRRCRRWAAGRPGPGGDGAPA